ncbi:MAG: hypothetical protein ACTS27_00245 [Phycisphaerales bacterium]
MRIRSVLVAAACGPLLSAAALSGDACGFDSAQRIGSGKPDFAFEVDLGNDGARLVAGSFAAIATFAPGVTRTAAGIEDLYVAKYAADGSLLFLTTTGAADFDGTNSAVLTPDGGAIAGGYFARTVQFGSDSLTYAGGLDAWIGKIDSNGAFVWARRAGSSNLEEARGVAVDADGNAYMAGYFNGTADFAPGVTITSAGNADVFLAKYSPTGDLLWVVRAGGTAFDSAEGMALDGGGGVFVVGRFQSTATFAPGVTVTSNGSSDVFLAKFDAADGSLEWVRAAGSNGTDRGVGVGTDSAGAAYITGFFRNTIAFESTVLTALNNDDMYLAKYDADGALQWAQNAGTSLNFVQGLALDANADGDLAVSGYFGGTANFGDASFGPVTQLMSAGSFDAFVATFDSDGALRCALRGGSGGFNADYGYGVAINESGAVAACGEFSGSATFGDLPLSGGTQDAWFATIPAPMTDLMGDVNGDGVVNFGDLNLVLSNFGATGTPGTVDGDANDDGAVNFADLNIVLSEFGSSN